jgi:shikimate kinase
MTANLALFSGACAHFPGRRIEIVILKLKRTPGIYLVGFMGCGKSTVGQALAERLGWSFIDLDKEIEQREGATISHIFDTRGEAEFRKIETEVLKDRVKLISRGRPNVVALGGGAFLSEDNINLVTNHGVPIWLDCPFADVQRRVAQETNRPLARDPVRFRDLFDSRRANYARAEHRIEVRSDDPQHAVADIMALKLV